MIVAAPIEKTTKRMAKAPRAGSSTIGVLVPIGRLQCWSPDQTCSHPPVWKRSSLGRRTCPSANDNQGNNKRDCHQYPNNPRAWSVRWNIPYRDYIVFVTLSTGRQALAVWRNLDVINPMPLLNERELLAAIDRVQQLDLIPLLGTARCPSVQKLFQPLDDYIGLSFV